MQLEAGQKLLQYELLSHLGEGGMGVVWRARDTHLNRDVAIKVLPHALQANSQRRLRFEREARLLASLNHPNVAQVYGFHEVGELWFLAMELVDGEDLSTRIAKGALQVDDTILVGRQVAAALDAAHSKGVVHRDLKPANIVLTLNGDAKVLDFGLARSTADEEGSADPSFSPTMTTPATLDGAILGTAAYMSPQQARGKPVGRDADIWALGCVLYECLTGKKAFGGETISDAVAAILRAEPDWSLLPAPTTAKLRRVIERCLMKEPKQRIRDAGDVELELEAAAQAEDAEIEQRVSDSDGGRFRPVIASLFLIAGLMLGALGWNFIQSRSEAPIETIRAHLNPPDGWWVNRSEISPNGRFVAIVAGGQNEETQRQERRLFIRDLQQDNDFRPIGGRVGTLVSKFSPDSKQLLFVQREVAGMQGSVLVRAPTDGSSEPSPVVPWNESWLDAFVWLSDNEVAIATKNPVTLKRIPLDGRAGQDTPLKLDPDERLRLKNLLPNGTILATLESWEGGYHNDVVHVDPKSGVVTALVDRGFHPSYVQSGHLLFSRGEQLLAAKFDMKSLELRSTFEVVQTGMMSEISDTASQYAISDRGDLVFVDGGVQGKRRTIAIMDRDGTRTSWGGVEGPFTQGMLDDSADGSVVTMGQVGPSGLFEVWASEFSTAVPRRALIEEGMDCSEASVSPDGSWIAAWCRGDPERRGLYLVPFPNVEPKGTRILSLPDREVMPASWLPDGSALLVRTLTGDEVGSIGLLPIASDGKPGEFSRVPGVEGEIDFAMVSPDGKLIAYTEWIATSWELRVASWDGQRAGPGRPVIKTANRGFDWTGVMRDGAHEIATTDLLNDARLVLIEPGGDVRAIEAIPNFSRNGGDTFGMTYLSDGRRLVLEPEPGETESQGVQLITNWQRSTPQLN